MSSPTPPLGTPVNILVYVTNGKVTGVSNVNPICNPPCIITWQFPVNPAAFPIDFGSNTIYFQSQPAAGPLCVSYLNRCTTPGDIQYSISGLNGDRLDPSIDNQPTGD